MMSHAGLIHVSHGLVHVLCGLVHDITGWPFSCYHRLAFFISAGLVHDTICWPCSWPHLYRLPDRLFSLLSTLIFNKQDHKSTEKLLHVSLGFFLSIFSFQFPFLVIGLMSCFFTWGSLSNAPSWPVVLLYLSHTYASVATKELFMLYKACYHSSILKSEMEKKLLKYMYLNVKINLSQSKWKKIITNF